MTFAITTRRLKLTIVAAAIVAIILFQFTISSPRHQAAAGSPAVVEDNTADPILDSLVEDFDRTIQQRFLTAPFFGFARIAPTRPTGPRPGHVSSFSPSTPEEYAAVAAFKKEGWDVGLYLFGRRVQPRTDTKKENDYDIRYRLFNPIPVTPGLKRSSFRKQKKLAEEAKRAFLEFQKPDSANKNEMRFEIGDWSYIARPVRASNQSCLECHKDYVITDKVAEGKFVARPRRIGDVNGVLFYALRKRDANN